jgi:hypothetical protein
VAYASPLTHVVELVRFGVFGEAHFASIWVPVTVLAAFLTAACTVAGPVFRRCASR